MSKSLSKSRFIEMFGDPNSNAKGYDKKPLRDLFALQMGKTPPRKEMKYWTDATNKWISISDMSTYDKYTTDTKEKIADCAISDTGIKVVPKNTVIMSFKLSIGKTAITSEDIYTNEAIMAFVKKNEKINNSFLSYALKMVDWTSTSSNAVKGVTLNKEIIGNKDFFIPPIELQNEFEKFSNQVDKSKFILQKMIEKLELLKKSRFIEMFGRLGKDEKGWGLAKLSSCCDVNPPKIGADLPDTYKVSFIPMASVSERGDIDTSDVIDLSEVRSGFSSFVENDVLFAKITPCMENGKGAVARRLFNKIGFGSTEFHVLRPKTNLCNPYWLYALTSLKEFRLIAEQRMTGSAGQKRVPAKFLSDFEISIPPIELQNKYVDFTKQLDKSKLILQKQLDDLVGETK